MPDDEVLEKDRGRRYVSAGLGSAAARCRPRRSSAGQNPESSLRAQIVLEVTSGPP
jgi:hypothetical protein